MTDILLDISRLVRRFDRKTLTGVDRVVLAYAQQLRALHGERTRFVYTAGSGISVLSRPVADRVLRAAEANLPERSVSRWAAMLANGAGKASLNGAVARGFVEGLLREVLPGSARNRRRRPIYMTLAHGALEEDGLVRRLHDSGAASCVAFLHDLIPLTHPEYVVPNTTERHSERIRTMATCCKLVITNSSDTQRRFVHYLETHRLPVPPVVSAHLGIESHWIDRRHPPAGGGEPPYFLVVGTIEPRKNHLLLLTVWRAMYDILGERTPRLYVIGRRGWENENILDMLERSPAVRRCVIEKEDMPDNELRALMRNARALLFPSFAEGYGLPLAEALALGVPVIASDLPIFREVAGSVPDYASPIDGRRWFDLVTSYASPYSPERDRQIERLSQFEPTLWPQHFDQVRPHLRKLGL